MKERTRKTWAQGELDLMVSWLQANPSKTYRDGAQEILTVLDGRALNTVRTKLGQLGRQMYGSRVGVKPSVPILPKKMNVPQPKNLSTLHLLFCEYAELLETIAKGLRGGAEDLEVLERWAEDSLTLRRKLAIQVDRNGVVYKVKRDDE